MKDKISITIELTPEELTETLNGLNNAIVAVGKIYGAARLGCDIPLAFHPLFEDKSFEEIDNLCESRLKRLYSLYEMLLTQEN